jgi:hypothetical protein
MSFSIGIIGLPNAGKSTLFKALTRKQVEISNYPFCTISPNVGVVKVPDERLEKLSQILKPKEVIPTVIEFVDIAGLIKDAHQGEGLGNQFLSHIRQVDAICHLVRIFEDEKVSHPPGEINPQKDIETINLELIFADLAALEKRLEKLKKEAKQEKKKAQLLEVAEKIKSSLEKDQIADQLELNEEEKEIAKNLNLLTLKPVIYVLNVDEDQLSRGAIPQLPGLTYQLPICAKLEAEIADLSPEEIKELNLKTTGLDQLIKISYQLLDLISFFTCQNNILQAWTLRKGSKIIEAASKIHTDFAKNFVRAEVIDWQKLVEAGSEIEAQARGWVRLEGRDSLVEDGQVIKIKSAGG